MPQLKAGTFRPLPVRERKIPKPGGSGKVRRLGIPTVADRVVQAALKLVLEPIFEADFVPVSYGFRPERRAHDAIAEIHLFGTQGYRWVLDADIEACFDSIDHTALMDRVRLRVKDKRVLRAGQGVPQGRDPHRTRRLRGHRTPARRKAASCPRCWPTSRCRCSMSTCTRHGSRAGRWSTSSRAPDDVAKGLPNWRIVRYADDFVVLVARHRRTTSQALREEIADVLAPLGLRLSQAKTQIVHMSDGFDFLGFHIQWRRKRGTNKWYVYTFIADRPFRSLKAKIRALTHRTSQQRPQGRADPAQPDHARLGQLLQARRRQAHLQHAGQLRLVAGRSGWLRTLHRWRWKDVRRRLTDPTGRWQPITRGRDRTVQPRSGTGHPVPLPGQHDPQPLDRLPTTPDGRNRGEPVALRAARRVRRAAWGNGPGAIAGTAPQADSSMLAFLRQHRRVPRRAAAARATRAATPPPTTSRFSTRRWPRSPTPIDTAPRS